MSIYEKPTKTLMREFAAAQLKKGQIFDKKLAVDWFAKHYPKIRSTTIQMHVEGMAVNATLRRHHPNVKEGSGHDLFFKVAPGKFRLWDAATDPPPAYGDQLLNPESGQTPEDDATERDEHEEEVTSSEFAFERDLRNYLAKNLQSLETGLRLYTEEGFTGLEFPVGGRFIDILAVDAQDGFVVIELKVSRGYDRVLGQLMRYMAWVQKHLADGACVRGAIVASEITEDLKLAASLLPGVKLIEYEIAFSLKHVKI